MPLTYTRPKSRTSGLSVLMMFCVLGMAAGCASATPAPTATSAAAGNPPSTAQPTTQPTGQTPSQPAATSPGTAQPMAQLAFADNGKTITLHVGSRVHVALDSAFWTFQPVAAPRLLQLDTTAYVSASPGTCAGPQAAGSGCGTKTADYTALATGTTSVVATRVSCGEAMRCTGANARFEARIVIVS